MTKAGSGVLLGHHYQANSGTAGEAITHSVGCVAGTRPLAIPCAFAHSMETAASVVLGARVQEITCPDAVPTVTLAAAAGDLLGACGDTIGMLVAAPVADETAVSLLAYLPVARVAIPAGTCPLARGHVGAVGVGGAAPMVLGTEVHL